MIAAAATLEAALDDAASYRWAVVAVFEMTGTVALKERLDEADWLRELAAFQRITLTPLMRSDHPTAVRGLGHRVEAVYEDADAPTALLDAMNSVETHAEQLDVPAWSVAVGVARGELVAFTDVTGQPQVLGEAVDRAYALAGKATAGHVLADSASAESAELRLTESAGARGVELSAPTTVRIRGLSQPLVYRELRWGRDTPNSPLREQLQVRSGKVASWDPEKGRGMVVGDGGGRHYFDRRNLAGLSTPRIAQRVYFLDDEPRVPGGNRLAAAVVGVGERVQGRVASVFPRRGYAFIELHDRAGNYQHLITGEDVDLGRLVPNAIVTCEVGENVRGAVARDVSAVEGRLGRAIGNARPDISVRFLAELVGQLRRQGQAGAARSVVTASGADIVPASISRELQRAQVFALADYVVREWAFRLLREIDGGGDDMIRNLESFLPIDSVHGADDAERVLATIRSGLRQHARAGNIVGRVSLEAAASVLAPIQLVLRHARAVTSGETEPDEDAAAARAAEHAGSALAVAFRSGVIPNLPEESRRVISALHKVG